MSDETTKDVPPLDETVTEIRRRVAAWRANGEKIALVPTMGALHAGHLALVERARRSADRTVVSIFVNPTQFGVNEDFPIYPRELDGDLVKLAHAADAVFGPSAAELYPKGFATSVSVGGPAEGLETDFRPDFFAGVATIVTKLLLAIGPDIAIFGEKDYQQLLVVRRLVTDLAMPVTIESYPVVRESDGLALSSRNAYLGADERRVAPRLYHILVEAAAGINDGVPAMTVIADARQSLLDAGFDVDYVELRDAATLEPVIKQGSEPSRILAAVRLGRKRLIDNVAVEPVAASIARS